MLRGVREGLGAEGSEEGLGAEGSEEGLGAEVSEGSSAILLNLLWLQCSRANTNCVHNRIDIDRS